MIRDLEKEYKENINKEIKEICSNRKVVIWGAGMYGYSVFKMFEENGFKKNLISFCDSNSSKWGTSIDSLNVFSYEYIKQNFKGNILFFICSSWGKEIKNKLITLGEKEEDIYLPKEFGYLQEEAILRNWNDMYFKSNKEYFNNSIIHFKSMLQDNESKEVLSARINLIKTGNWKCLNNININKEQYFLNDFYELTDKEIYVDLGSWNGDTILRFVNKVNRKYKKIIAFEPEKEAYKSLKLNIEKNNLKNIETYNLGSWNEKTAIKFISNNTGSYINSEKIQIGENISIIHTEALDNLFIDIPITFIKMDIEGAEKESILGAKEIIKKYKPKLAISVYHKWEDIYMIPKMIKELVPEYKLYLRHHSSNITETVCYACI